jgi:ribose transport system substrate-binding protein
MQRRLRAGFAIGVGLLLIVSAGCGTTSENTGTGGGGAAKRAEKCQGPNPKEPYKIAMSQANLAEPYRERMDDDIRRAARKVRQFAEVRFADAQQKTDKQADDVRNFVTQQVDLLIVSPNQASLGSVVKQAYDKGIPVIVLDRKLDNENSYTTFIGADNTDIGRRAGTYIASKLLPNGGKLVELKGLSGSTPANERHDGFTEATKGKKIDVVASEDGEWLRDKGQTKMDAILKANPEIDVVYSHNDPMAEGAYLAAKAAGREKQIKFVGIDGLPIPSGGIKAVEAGRLSATFIYPTGGAEAIEAAKKILIDCRPPAKVQTLPTQQVTRENAAEVYARANDNTD